MEDPLAEEKAENEAKIEEVRNHFWEVASVADGGLISEIIFNLAPSTPARTQIPANLSSQFSLSGRIFFHGAAATLKGLAEF